jgi:hypothetical protein
MTPDVRPDFDHSSFLHDFLKAIVWYCAELLVNGYYFRAITELTTILHSCIPKLVRCQKLISISIIVLLVSGGLTLLIVKMVEMLCSRRMFTAGTTLDRAARVRTPLSIYLK